MKPFKIDDMYFEYKYETLLEELNIFNFSINANLKMYTLA